jgi:phosphate transport system substrate-binding protein
MNVHPQPRRSVRLGAFALLLCAATTLTSARAETLRFGGTGSAIGTVKLLAQAYRRIDPTFEIELVPNLGSGGGIKAVLVGATQLGAASRALQPDEVAAGARAVEYGRTPFMLVTSRAGLAGLSLSEVADLYSMRQRRWPDGQLVRLVLRPRSDADTALLASFSPAVKAGLEHAMAQEGMVVGKTDQEAVDSVERLSGALGTTTLALLLSEKRRALPLAIDGVAPTVANLANGSYPFGKTMYLVVRADANPSVLKFVEFAGSPAGRRLLAETGHLAAPASASVAAR